MHDPVNVHSPLGASSAERWMNCPGSYALLDHVHLLAKEDDPEYRREGTAAHKLAEECLHSGQEAWERIGDTVEGQEVSADMADAVQAYLDNIRASAGERDTLYIEKHIGQAEDQRPHPKFYGTVDCAIYGEARLTVIDYKHGQGVVVEPEWNPQMLYYAYGVLLARPRVRDECEVVLRIVQPRAFHKDGPIREWATTAGEVVHWGETELIPAMQRAEMDKQLNPGDWCRFCPVKALCPMLTALFGAAMTADPAALPSLSDDALGRSYGYVKAVEMYVGALEKEVFSRLSAAHEIAGAKLVRKQSKRVYSEGAEEKVKELFGLDAFTTALKSPAELEKLGPPGKEFVKEFCYFPDTGLTVAPEKDRREAVKVQTAEQVFGDTVANMILPPL